MLKDEPHTQKVAESAIGLRTDNGRPEKILIETEMTVDAIEPAKERVEANDDVEYNAFFSVY